MIQDKEVLQRNQWENCLYRLCMSYCFHQYISNFATFLFPSKLWLGIRDEIQTLLPVIIYPTYAVTWTEGQWTEKQHHPCPVLIPSKLLMVTGVHGAYMTLSCYPSSPGSRGSPPDLSHLGSDRLQAVCGKYTVSPPRPRLNSLSLGCEEGLMLRKLGSPGGREPGTPLHTRPRRISQNRGIAWCVSWEGTNAEGISKGEAQKGLWMPFLEIRVSQECSLSEKCHFVSAWSRAEFTLPGPRFSTSWEQINNQFSKIVGCSQDTLAWKNFSTSHWL